MYETLADTGIPLFLGMVFVAVFLLAHSLMAPAFGGERQQAKRLRKRVADVIEDFKDLSAPSLLREQQLKTLSPLARWLESLPGMQGLSLTIAQAGRNMPAHRLVLLAIGLGVAGCTGSYILIQHPVIALMGGALAGYLPFMVIKAERNRRLTKFEEQLPEALDIVTRALRAGHPFNESLHLVAQEMDGPVAKEFGMTFNDINYGSDVRGAFLYLLERVPSMALMTLVTSVLVQRESGGNLAEILEKISKLVRGRFRFQRKVRTLSAEGRMSAWVLTLTPFGLFALLSVTSPDYLPVLVHDPLGRKLIGGAFVLMVLGIFWMRRIIRIDV